jgi:AcrR family transcriptional regulator
MANSPHRTYLSALRKRQANATRRRIATAARGLFLEHGFDSTTVEAVARAADVSPQTVYAVFGSKRGLLADLLERAGFGSAYVLSQQVPQTADPAARLRLVARIVRQIYDAERTEIELLRGAGVVDPELAAQERDKEGIRYEAQAAVIAYLVEVSRLRPDLDVAAARDILWALTGRDVYRMLVLERRWDADRYQSWLESTLDAALVAPKQPSGPRGTPKKRKGKA